MTKRGLRLIPRWTAGFYLAWSLFVFFGSMGSESHSWWPIFLYPIIWPLSRLYEELDTFFLDLLFPGEKSEPPNWVWTANDAASGAFYILVGTIWIWLLTRFLLAVATRIIPLRAEKAKA